MVRGPQFEKCCITVFTIPATEKTHLVYILLPCSFMIHFNIIFNSLSLSLCLSNSLPFQDFLRKYCSFLHLSHGVACLIYTIFFDLITLIMFGTGCTLQSTQTLCSILSISLSSFTSTLSSRTNPSLCSQKKKKGVKSRIYFTLS